AAPAGSRRAASDSETTRVAGSRRAAAVSADAAAPASDGLASEPEAARTIPSPAARSREFRAEDAPNLDLHSIMRLLLASHDLDIAADQAEAGEITVAELAEVARRTRSAAVDLVAAWYGGPDHMRRFGEVLLQAAAETAR
ncbi:hypothetical protein ABZ319_38775, partial [Nocardia sp. NPDC005978]